MGKRRKEPDTHPQATELEAAVLHFDRAAEAYFTKHGDAIEHDDSECPRDDTCECETRAPFTTALHALTLLARRLREHPTT